MHTEHIHSVLDLIALPIPDFVDEAYRLLLNRIPSPLERMERAGVLRAGLGRFRFLADMAQSAEFRQREKHLLDGGDDIVFVHVLFHRYLGRAPESDGLNHYVELLTQGKSRARLVRNIARSGEARLKRTFWFELEHLIAVERAERHWFWRWFGRGARQRRLRNQEYEALRQYILGQEGTPQSRPAAPNLNAPDDSAHWHIDPQSQGHDTRRATVRLQHAARRG